MDSYNQTRRKALTIGAAILIVGGLLDYAYYTRAVNRWPKSFTQRLTDLKAAGVPTSLAECDRHYRALPSDRGAVEHFRKAFAAMSKEQLPLMGLPHLAPLEPRPPLPRFSEIASLNVTWR